MMRLSYLPHAVAFIGSMATIVGDMFFPDIGLWAVFILLTIMLLLVDEKVRTSWVCGAIQVLGIGYFIVEILTTKIRRSERNTEYEAAACVVRSFIMVGCYAGIRKLAADRFYSKECLKSVSSIIGDIALSLETYDVSLAYQFLCNTPDLPENVFDSLSLLVHNVQTHKPYLPQSCFLRNDSSALRQSSTPGLVPKSEQSCQSIESPGSLVGLKKFSNKEFSIAVVNIKNSLALLSDPPSFAYCLSLYVSTLNENLGRSRGILEHLLGDRAVLTFGASKPCKNTSSSCYNTCLSILKQTESLFRGFNELSFNVGMEYGSAYCGVLGSSDCLRFSLIGTLPLWVSCIERVGASIDAPIIVGSNFTEKLDIPFKIVLYRVQFNSDIRFLYTPEDAIDLSGRCRFCGLQHNTLWRVESTEGFFDSEISDAIFDESEECSCSAATSSNLKQQYAQYNAVVTSFLQTPSRVDHVSINKMQAEQQTGHPSVTKAFDELFRILKSNKGPPQIVFDYR